MVGYPTTEVPPPATPTSSAAGQVSEAPRSLPLQAALPTPAGSRPPASAYAISSPSHAPGAAPSNDFLNGGSSQDRLPPDGWAAPTPGPVGFVEAIQLGFKNYLNFTGRSTRAEYWWFALTASAGYLLAAGLDSVLIPGSYNAYTGAYTHASVFETLELLAVMIPTLAVGIRRLRDAGRPWYYIFFSLIPLVGGIILVIFISQGTSSDGWGTPTSQKNVTFGTSPATRVRTEA